MLLKLDRAKEHIDQFHIEWSKFISRKPFKVVRENHEDTGGFTDRIQILAEPDLERFGLIMGDALHNLRSALDYLIWQLVESNGCAPTSKTRFPICRDKGVYDTVVDGAVDGIGSKARHALNLIKPYGGGCEALWTLHRLDVQDKHQLLVLALMRLRDIGLDLGRAAVASMPSDMAQLFGETSMVITLQPDEDRSIYDGAELFTSGDSLGVHMKPQYRIGPEIAPGQPGQGMDFAEVFLGLGYLTQRIIRILGRYLRD